MDGSGGYRLGDPGAQTDHPGEVGLLRGLANAANDHLIDCGRINTGAGEDTFDHGSAQVAGTQLWASRPPALAWAGELRRRYITRNHSFHRLLGFPPPACGWFCFR